MSHLLSVPNIVEREEAKVIARKNKIFRVKNCALVASLVGLASFGALSFSSYRKSASELDKMHKDNQSLKAKTDRLQANVVGLTLENRRLKQYANDAEIFANSLREPMPDMVDVCKTLDEEAEMEKQNMQQKKAYEDACRTLGIDYEQLIRLQKGWGR